MRKITISALTLSILLATVTPLRSQTRPRRVTQTTDIFSESTPRARADERPRVAGDRARTVRDEARREGAGRQSRWPRILLGAGIAIGTGRVGRSRSCTPSRPVLGGLPRLMSQVDSPR